MDRNKTELTENITRNVALWMDSRGFKPVETEVGVERGWVADVAGVCCPTQTEMIALKLLKHAPRWRYDGDNSAYEAWKVQRDAIPSPLTALVEVKTSIGDYRGDRKWTSNWPTNLCYVAMPEGMIPASQWPFGWGVILFSQQGTTIRRSFPSAVRPIIPEQQLAVILSIAVRRDHATRYARMRDLQKAFRVREGERKTVVRVTNALQAVLAIRGGEPIEEALRYHGIKPDSIPSYIKRDLRQLIPAVPA